MRPRSLADLEPYGLVNNAGYALTGAIEDVSDDEARQLFETMVFAPMRLARLALPGMREPGRRAHRQRVIHRRPGQLSTGRLVHGGQARPRSPDRRAAHRGRPATACRVSLVEPGGFKTGIWDDMARDIERHHQAGSRNTPAYERSMQLQRLIEPIMGSPAQCARVIAGAVDARNPRDRYLVGVDAQAMRLGDRLTPNLVQDRVMRLVLGL